MPDIEILVSCALLSSGTSSSTESSFKRLPMGIYAVVSSIAAGHVVTTILIAMAAMLLTSVSNGRMAHVYPQTGSAFTYVSFDKNCLLPFLIFR